MHSDGRHKCDRRDTMGVKGFAHEGVPEAARGFWPVGRVVILHITWVLGETGFLEDEVVEVLVGEDAVEVVEGSMVVGKTAGDCIVDTVVGIMRDNMVGAFGAFVVGNFGFVELIWVVICWQQMGG